MEVWRPAGVAGGSWRISILEPAQIVLIDFDPLQFGRMFSA